LPLGISESLTNHHRGVIHDPSLFCSFPLSPIDDFAPFHYGTPRRARFPIPHIAFSSHPCPPLWRCSEVPFLNRSPSRFLILIFSAMDLLSFKLISQGPPPERVNIGSHSSMSFPFIRSSVRKGFRYKCTAFPPPVTKANCPSTLDALRVPEGPTHPSFLAFFFFPSRFVVRPGFRVKTQRFRPLSSAIPYLFMRRRVRGFFTDLLFLIE